MPIIEPGNPDLKNLQGLHLWHAGLSSCSQRVRLTLAELGCDFESHIVDLHDNEQASEAYQQINPKGVVPALVHDGTLVIESMDIIAYLDEILGGGALRPAAQEDDIARLIKRADEAQTALKVCTHEFLFTVAPPKSQDAMDRYQETHNDEALKKFHRDCQAGLERSRIDAAVNYSHTEFQMLDDLLADGRQWLAGDTFSLADTAWMPNFHRFDLLRWPLDRYPNLSRWFAAASARESYRIALQEWEPQGMLDMVAPKVAARQAEGNGIETYGKLAA
jgi:glutathione S-transferase